MSLPDGSPATSASRLAIWRSAWRLALGVRRRPLTELLDQVSRGEGLPAVEAAGADPAALAELVNAVVNRWTVPIAGPCLVRSLMLFGRLAPEVPGLRITLGFRREGESTPGHAWLSVGGEPLLPGDRNAPQAYPYRVALP